MKLKNLILSVMVSVGIIAFCMATLKSGAIITNAENEILTTELFLPSGVKYQPVQTDSDMVFADKGVRITFDSENKLSLLKNNFVGKFDFEYIPEKNNGNYSVKELEITFKDLSSDNTLSIFVEHGDKVQASVQFGNVRAGIFYSSAGVIEGLTKVSNQGGQYTAIAGDKVFISFDPGSMCVFAGAGQDDLSLVWNLRNSSNDGYDIGKVLNTFGKYSVTVSANSLNNENGSLVLYSLNGLKLDKLIIDESSEPIIFADYVYEAVVDEQYIFPEAYASDVKDGIIRTSFKVLNSAGKVVAENVEGFVFTEQGDYKVKYSAQNSSGIIANKEYVLKVYAECPAYDTDIDFVYNIEYEVGQIINIRKNTVQGGLLRYGTQTGKVTLWKNSQKIEEYTNILSGFEFTVPEEGDYKIEYLLGAESNIFLFSAVVKDTKFITEGLKKEYYSGDLLDCSNFSVIKDGKKTEFDFYVEYPDGSIYSHKLIEFNQCGEYKFYARTMDLMFESKTVVLAKTADSFSTVYDGVSMDYDASAFTGRSGVKITAGQSGALIKYNTPIDLTAFVNQTVQGANGVRLSETAKPIIELSVDPAGYGTAAASAVFVYIEDANDPENRLTINLSSKGSSLWTYAKAAAPGQVLTGFRNTLPSENHTHHLNGADGVLDTNWGYLFYHSFNGTTEPGRKPEDSKIALYFDSEKNQILTIDRYSTPESYADRNHIIMDFDDPQYTDGKVWKGFSSDKVYISFMTMTTASSANTIIYSIGGTELTESVLVYNQGPKITFKSDTDGLKGIEGGTFTLPEANTVDQYGGAVKSMTVKAYYLYNEILCDINVKEGKIETERAGEYLIKYIAEDFYGNKTIENVEVKVDSKYSVADIVMSFEEDPAEEYLKAIVGLEKDVIEKDRILVENAIGDYEIKCNIFYGAEIVKSDGFSFLPEKEGVYRVEYTVVDSVGRIALNALEYEVKCDYSDKPVIVSPIPVFTGFVYGSVYDIPEMLIIDYSSDNHEEQKAEIYVDGKLLDGNTYSFVSDVDNADTREDYEPINIEYKYQGEVLEYLNRTLSFEVPIKTVYKEVEKTSPSGIIINYKEHLYERYFIEGDTIKVPAEDGEKGNNYVVIAANGEDMLGFARPLSSNLITFKFDPDFDKNPDLSAKDTNVKSIIVKITDIYDENKSVSIRISTDKNSGKVVLNVNGLTSSPFTGSLTGISANMIQFGYRNDNFSLFDLYNNVSLMTINSYTDGKPFEGFGEKVYISFGIERIDSSKSASFRLNSINNQIFSNSTEKETTPPSIYVEGSLSGVYDLGKEICIYKGFADDVLSDIKETDFHVSVIIEKNGQGHAAKDVNNLILDKVPANREYRVILSEAGEYIVTYFAKDNNGNEQRLVFTITVICRQKPEIIYSGTIPNSAKAGSKIVIPSFDVKFAEENDDNVSYALYISPSGKYQYINGNEFVASEAGVYRIRFYALDIFGNYMLEEYVMYVY